jgi:ribosomal protein S18 acetylase RimI-like enzyme
VGTILVTAALQLAARKRVASMLLEVDPGNRPAVDLYRGLGFTELTERPDYYGPGRNALIMSRPVERRNR